MCPLNGWSGAWQVGGSAHILRLWQKLQLSEECGTELLWHVIMLSGWLMRLRGWGGVSDVLCLHFSKPLFLSCWTSSSIIWENKIQTQLLYLLVGRLFQNCGVEEKGPILGESSASVVTRRVMLDKVRHSLGLSFLVQKRRILSPEAHQVTFSVPKTQ